MSNRDRSGRNSENAADRAQQERRQDGLKPKDEGERRRQDGDRPPPGD